MNIFLISSENQNKFGISKVISELKKELKSTNKIKYSKNIVKFIKFKTDILHIHGCWKLRLLVFFLLAKLLKIKIVISPHGMMDQNSLEQKKIKKEIAFNLYQKFMFNYADLIIVNSNNEKKNLLNKISALKKISIIPHGVNIEKNFLPKKNLNKDLKFVFFSRIHKSKNLQVLVSLWEQSLYLKKFKLDIFGEIQDLNYFTKINEIIKKNININYLGPIKKKIQSKLSKYDVFILPSKSENFGLVIYEALSAGLFLILNRNLKKKDLALSLFSKNIDFNLKTLEKNIFNISNFKKKIKSLSYKRKSLSYIKKNYNWTFIAKDYLDKYLFLTKKN